MLRTARAAVAEGAAGPVRAAEPCGSCPVITSCDGHVITQTHFVQLNDYLLHGASIRW